MKVQGQDRQDLYTLFELFWRKYTGVKWNWKRGEKGRVIKAFTYICEFSDIRDEELYLEVFEIYRQYLSTKFDEWSKWSGRSRVNIIGFVSNRDRIASFCSMFKVNNHDVANAFDSGVGLDGKEAWDV